MGYKCKLVIILLKWMLKENRRNIKVLLISRLIAFLLNKVINNRDSINLYEYSIKYMC